MGTLASRVRSQAGDLPGEPSRHWASEVNVLTFLVFESQDLLAGIHQLPATPRLVVLGGGQKAATVASVV